MGTFFSHNTVSILETLEYGELKYADKRSANQRSLMGEHVLDRRKRSSKEKNLKIDFSINSESDLSDPSEGRQFGIAGVDYDTIYLSIGPYLHWNNIQTLSKIKLQ